MDFHHMSTLSGLLKMPLSYFNKISMVQESKLTSLVSNPAPSELQSILDEDIEVIESALRTIDPTATVGTEVPDSLLFKLLAHYNIILTRVVRDSIVQAISKNPSSRLVNLKIFLALLAYWKSKCAGFRSRSVASTNVITSSASFPDGKNSVHNLSVESKGRITIKRLIDEFPDILHVIDVYNSRIKLEGKRYVHVDEFSVLIPGSIMTELLLVSLTQLGYMNSKTKLVSVAKLAEDLSLAVHSVSNSNSNIYYNNCGSNSIDNNSGEGYNNNNYKIRDNDDERLAMRSKSWHTRLFNIKDAVFKELNKADNIRSGYVSKQNFKSILWSLGSILSLEDFENLWNLLKEIESTLIRHLPSDLELSHISIQYFFQTHQPVLDNRAISSIMGTNDRSENRSGSNYALSAASSSIGDTIFQINLASAPMIIKHQSHSFTEGSVPPSPSSVSRRSYQKEMDGQSRLNSVQNLLERVTSGETTTSAVLANNNLRFAQSNQSYNNSTNNEYGVSSLLNQENILAQMKLSEGSSRISSNIDSSSRSYNGRRSLDLSSHNEPRTATNTRSNIIHRFNEQLSSPLSLSKLVLDMQILQKRNANTLSRFAIQEALLMSGVKLAPAVGDSLWSELCQFSSPDAPSIAKLFFWLGLTLPDVEKIVPDTSAKAIGPIGSLNQPQIIITSSDKQQIGGGSITDTAACPPPVYSTPLRSKSPTRGDIAASASAKNTGVLPAQFPGLNHTTSDFELPMNINNNNNNSHNNNDNNNSAIIPLRSSGNNVLEQPNKSSFSSEKIRASVKEKLRTSRVVAGDRVKLLALTGQLRSRLGHKLSRGDLISYEASPDTCSPAEFKGLLESIDVWLSMEECENIFAKVSEYCTKDGSSSSSSIHNDVTKYPLHQIGELVLSLSQYVR